MSRGKQQPQFDDTFDPAEYAPDFSEFPHDDEPVFYLCWQTQDGFVGRGQTTGTYQDVLEAVAQANEDTPQFKHWVGCGRFEPDEHNCGFVQLPDVFGFTICPF